MAIYYCDVMTQDGKIHEKRVYKENTLLEVKNKKGSENMRVIKIIKIHADLNNCTFYKQYDAKKLKR